jgi:ABC-type dipeptide/oligopeptide/nickel transport system ATPase component
MLRACHKLRRFSSMPPKQPIIAIVGSTGTGKSDVDLSVMPIVTLPRLTTAAS